MTPRQKANQAAGSIKKWISKHERDAFIRGFILALKQKAPK
jgi:hypothetical protein